MIIITTSIKVSNPITKTTQVLTLKQLLYLMEMLMKGYLILLGSRTVMVFWRALKLVFNTVGHSKVVDFMVLEL
jgi:hypothetical protein